MGKPKIYIDGQSGTTGLEIRQRLQDREDIELLVIDDALRHDDAERRKMFEAADLAFLCLPDQAARKAVDLAEGSGARIIDASTAHRTDWTYGFPELDHRQEEKIRTADKVANPGCHATGFIAAVAPLSRGGLLKPDAQLTAFSLTGYTGGGKRMIAEYEGSKTEQMLAPKAYGLDLNHKHLPEMKTVCGLEKAPLFIPVVDDYPRGMLVMVPVASEQLTRPLSLQEMQDHFRQWYQGTAVAVQEGQPGLYTGDKAGTDDLELFVTGAESGSGFVIAARFDNLGKGACGAAIRNMELMLGLDTGQ